MKLNIDNLNRNISSLAKKYKEEKSKSHDPNRNHEKLKSFSERLKNKKEEQLFHIFLASHFDSPDLAHEFYYGINGSHKGVTWRKLQDGGETFLKKACKSFFNSKEKPYKIGNHRGRNFNDSKSKNDLAKYTKEVISSYQKKVVESGSQEEFFELNKKPKPKFKDLFSKFKNVHGFGRLGRWDHLERLSRTNNFYIIPERIYSEGSTGPLKGLNYLFFGKKSQNTKAFKEEKFIKSWNKKMNGKCKISEASKVFDSVERWVIDETWRKVSNKKEKDDDFIFNLESCLCNWQKRKKEVVNEAC